MLEKKTGFTFNHSDQQDDLYTSMTTAEIKTAFDSRGEELKEQANAIVDALQATTEGDSGADNIGASTITGVTGNTVQAQTKNLKEQIDALVTKTAELEQTDSNLSQTDSDLENMIIDSDTRIGAAEQNISSLQSGKTDKSLFDTEIAGLKTTTTNLQSSKADKTEVQAVQSQVDRLVVDGDSSPAIAQALAGSEFTTLKQKLDSTDTLLAENTQDIGDVTTLKTVSKSSVVNAVNEIVTNLSDTSATITTVPAYNLTLDNFRKWRKAIGRVKAGTGFAKLLVVADSTGWGLGAGGADDKAWPKLLGNDLNRIYPTQYSFVVPPSTAGTGVDVDSRWNAGSGWVKTGWGFGGQAAWQASNGVTTPLTVTPGINCDTADIYFLRNSGLGSISISVDGGTATTVSTAGTPFGWAKTTVTFPAGSSHVISITPSVNTVFILGVETYLSATPSVRLMNAGVPDSRAYSSTNSWSTSSGGHSLDGIGLIAPDLTIVMLGVNDARVATTTTPDQWETAVRAIVAKAKLSGDVVIASVIPTRTTITGAFDLEKLYRERALTIANDLGCAFVDILNRYKDWDTANAAGFMFDELHLTPEGGGDTADAFRVILTR